MNGYVSVWWVRDGFFVWFASVAADRIGSMRQPTGRAGLTFRMHALRCRAWQVVNPSAAAAINLRAGGRAIMLREKSNTEFPARLSGKN